MSIFPSSPTFPTNNSVEINETMLSSLTNISVKAAGSYNHYEHRHQLKMNHFMYSLTCLELQIMSTVEKFILANIFVSMIRSTTTTFNFTLPLAAARTAGQSSI